MWIRMFLEIKNPESVFSIKDLDDVMIKLNIKWREMSNEGLLSKVDWESRDGCVGQWEGGSMATLAQTGNVLSLVGHWKLG